MGYKSWIDLGALSAPLTIDQVDFRIQSINKYGMAIMLAYKDARVDMQRLDEVCGPLNWKREHTRDNKNCVVSIWDEDKSQWVSKEDTGKESYTEAEKGLASDSFKRACSNWGIGRELYHYPELRVQLLKDEYTVEKDKANGRDRARQTWNLKLKEWRWESDFDENGKITLLVATDQKGIERYRWVRHEHEPIIGDTTSEVLDSEKLVKARNYFKAMIDQGEPDKEKMKAAFSRLSNDEKIAVMNLFGDAKPDGSRRYYRTMLGDIVDTSDERKNAIAAFDVIISEAVTHSEIKEAVNELSDMEREMLDKMLSPDLKNMLDDVL